MALVLLVSGGAFTGSMQRQVPSKAQTEQAVMGETFTGAIATGHMKGGLHDPHLVVEVTGDDGKKVPFNLRKDTFVTDADGKVLDFMKDFRKGQKVEIKYTVVKGENNATSMYYLEWAARRRRTANPRRFPGRGPPRAARNPRRR